MTVLFTATGTTFTGAPAGAAPITADFSTAGPTVNGRDQAAAFPNGSKVYWWYITGAGQTPAFLASLSSASPTLPTSYTGANKIAITQMVVGNVITQTIALSIPPGVVPNGVNLNAQSVFYDDSINDCSTGVVSAVNGTPTTSVSLAEFVPSEANLTTIEMYSANGGSVNNSFLGFRSGETYAKATSGPNDYDTLVATVPNISQTVYTANQYSGGGTELFVLGYEV